MSRTTNAEVIIETEEVLVVRRRPIPDPSRCEHCGNEITTTCVSAWDDPKQTGPEDRDVSEHGSNRNPAVKSGDMTIVAEN